MTALSFTGTRQFTYDDLLYHLMDEHSAPPGLWEWIAGHNGFITGGCIGFDSLIGAALARWPRFKNARHTVVLPANRSQVDSWYLNPDVRDRVNVIEMPEGTSYRDRDVRLVELGDELFYAADKPEDHGASLRSGTWMTVRIARKLNKPMRGIVLHND
jgi:hypothetical protein